MWTILRLIKFVSCFYTDSLVTNDLFYPLQHPSLTLQLFNQPGSPSTALLFDLHLHAFAFLIRDFLSPLQKHFVLFCYFKLQPCCYALLIILTFIALRLNYILSFISASHSYKKLLPCFWRCCTHHRNRKDAVHPLILAICQTHAVIFSLWLWYDRLLQDFSNMFWMQQEERLFLTTCRRLLQGKGLISAWFLLSDSLDSHTCAAL